MEESRNRIDNKKPSDFEMEETGEDTKKGGARHRKKHLVNKLRVQMEFYFSAANLSKDKFMNGLLENSPYIDLDIFFRFNKIRSFTEDFNLLKRAVEKSPILELSDDKRKVKRRLPVNKKENETLCTIYVENIPSHVDHEWVHEVFAKYGTIDYISFPRFKSTGRPKGFAFIEFETPEMANVALHCFGAAGCKIPIDTEPSKLRSICTHEKANDGNQLHIRFDEGQESDNGIKSSDATSMEGTDESINKEIENQKIPKKNGSGKRKRAESEDSEAEKDGIDSIKTVLKKSKTVSSKSSDKASAFLRDNDLNEENEPGKNETKVQEEAAEDFGKKVGIDEIESVIQEVRKSVAIVKESVEEGSEGKQDQSSQAKRPLEDEPFENSKKQKLDVNLDKEQSMTVEESVTAKKLKKKRKRSRKEKVECLGGISLKVMSKQEWTRLRNEYLNMQKRYMETLKWDLQKRKYVPAEEYTPTKIQSKGMPKFIADVVIKISFEEPPQDPKKLHDAIREGGGGGVAYVETSAVEKDVYVRFITSEAAAAYLKAGLWSRMTLLSGEEEKMYWNHLIDSWLMRRDKNKRRKGASNDTPSELRGREKLLQKAIREARNDKPVCHKVFEA